MLSWEADLESTDGHVIKVTIYFVEHLLVSVRVSFQSLSFPSHRHGFQTRWEYLEHQGFIFRVDNHSLIEVAHMFNRVCSTVVDGECWLMEPPRKYCPFNLAREGQLGNLVQYFAHSVIF